MDNTAYHVTMQEGSTIKFLKTARKVQLIECCTHHDIAFVMDRPPLGDSVETLRMKALD